MTAEELVNTIEAAGGILVTSSGRIRYTLPARVASLVDALRVHKRAVIDLLETRRAVAPELELPQGVKLVRWTPKTPPIVLTRWSVVTDSSNFIRTTLVQLEAALRKKDWLAGNWSVRELADRLEQVGFEIVLDARTQNTEDSNDNGRR
jgi:hypothetical protein